MNDFGVEKKGDPVYWTNSVRAVLEQSSAHDVAALFKLLLRKLPDPLFTTEYVDVFSQVTGTCIEGHQIIENLCLGQQLDL